MINGHLHPISQLMRKAVNVFLELGFDVYQSPEIESEWYNFDFLRVPGDHPARDVQDTFWLKDGRVLRTHTTAGQGHYTKNHQPPFRVVMPGRVFRNEATDATHLTTLNQLDGCVISKDATMAELIGTLEHLFKEIFGDNIKTRVRPHHYPFVEPGMDMDIFYNGRWIEGFGCGMIHPEVLENMGLDPQEWKGWAFGIGMDRIAMIYYGLDDIRHLFKGDLRFLKQF